MTDATDDASASLERKSIKNCATLDGSSVATTASNRYTSCLENNDAMQSKKRSNSKKFDDRWNEMYDRLAQYKEKHGDCLVPNRYKEDRSLGAWVSSQRRLYRLRGSSGEQQMDSDRVKMLDGLGFVWGTKDPRQVPWETRFEQLVEFKQQHGHCLVPIGYKQNPKLANWVSAQRQEGRNLREGRHSRLSDDKIAKLDSIGFVWRAPKGASGHGKRVHFQELCDTERRKKRSSSTVCRDNNPIKRRHGTQSADSQQLTRDCAAVGGGALALPSTRRTFSAQHHSDNSLAQLPLLASSASLSEGDVALARRQVLQQEERLLRAAISRPGEHIVGRDRGLAEQRRGGAPFLIPALQGTGTQDALFALRALAARRQAPSSSIAQTIGSGIVAPIIPTTTSQSRNMYDLISSASVDSSFRRGSIVPGLSAVDLYAESVLNQALLLRSVQPAGVESLRQLAPTSASATISAANPAVSLLSERNTLLLSALEQAALLGGIERRLRTGGQEASVATTDSGSTSRTGNS